MDHQACIDIIIGASINDGEFATTTFFSRSTNQADSTRQIRFFQGSGCTQESANGSRGDQIVTTSMANVWKGIILGIVGDNATAISIFGEKRGLYSKSVWCHLESEISEQLGDVVVCFELLESQFRIAVDLSNKGKVSLDVSQHKGEIVLVHLFIYVPQLFVIAVDSTLDEFVVAWRDMNPFGFLNTDLSCDLRHLEIKL
jgi:hypothetical protein